MAKVIRQDASGFYYVETNKGGCWKNYNYIDPNTGQYTPDEPHMLNNAELICGLLLDYGWTLKPICGVLGNMAAESRMNPAQGEDGKKYLGNYGYGLCQWTPSKKYTNWAKQHNHSIFSGYYQTDFLDDTGQDEWIINPSYSYNITWTDFIIYNGTAYDSEWLAMAFFRNYERGAYLPTYRQDCAAWYYSYFSGTTPPDPPTPDPAPYQPYRVQGMPPWMMLKRREVFEMKRKESLW